MVVSSVSDEDDSRQSLPLRPFEDPMTNKEIRVPLGKIPVSVIPFRTGYLEYGPFSQCHDLNISLVLLAFELQPEWCFKRYSRSSLNRQQEVTHCTTPPQLKLLDYVQKRKERKAAPQHDLKISKAGNCVDMWKQTPCYLTAPSEVDVEKYAKVEKSIKTDDSQPSVWPAHFPDGSLIFNPLQHQQQQLPQFSSQPPTTLSPQQQGNQGSEQVSTNQDQALSAQQTAILNLTGVGNFMQPQGA
ncbi:hypothetical protein JD844_010086, partial [Phrynosoma platyrhinos]